LIARIARPARGVALALALLAGPALAQLPGNRTLAPRFAIESLSGEKLDLEVLRRRGPVLLDFWATWCKPCLTAIPELEQIHKEFAARGLTVIGISVDGPRNFAKVRPFVTRLGITYPVAIDEDGSLQQKFHIRAMPTTVLVDTSGTIVHVKQGFRPGEGEHLKAPIAALLPTPARSDTVHDAVPDTTAGGER
jgi:peroxiredoxin